MESVRINPNMRSFQGVVFFRIPPGLEDGFTMEDAFVEFRVYEHHNGKDGGACHEIPVHFRS
jgi:hypothetical protein